MKVRMKLAAIFIFAAAFAFNGCSDDSSKSRAKKFDPAQCEALNQINCMLPYPSSWFLIEDESTNTGYRLNFPEGGMPEQTTNLGTGVTRPISPEPYRVLDGFSPTVQILMHFQGPDFAGVDLEASGVARLLEATRTTDATSLEITSPTVLIKVNELAPASSEWILHWCELDVRADVPERQVMFLRPGISLEPGARYIAAVRGLKDEDGLDILPEPVFKMFRDNVAIEDAEGIPGNIVDVIDSRRDSMEEIFDILDAAGVDRADLLLAFDFVIQSEEGLTSQMTAMRDETFALMDVDSPGFTAAIHAEYDCSEEGVFVWRKVHGTYEVPLYLDSDPEENFDILSYMVVDADGVPQIQGTSNPPYTIAIPCSAKEVSNTLPLLLGHGLFGSGRSFVRDVFGDDTFKDFDYIVGATDFRGLSSLDLALGSTGVALLKIFQDFDRFRSLPDRLRQGHLNTLVLARMMKEGVFNSHAAFQHDGTGVFPGGVEDDMYYFGASLGGIMGAVFAALTPDVERFNLDVPAINFSFMLPRATPFLELQEIIDQINDNPMDISITYSILHELWVRGEPSGYIKSLAEDVAAGDKKVLLTVAWLDQQVATQGAEMMARSLVIPNLSPGSYKSAIPLIADEDGPLPSAQVIYNTGGLDPDDPAHAEWVPPLANLQAEPNSCDPHYHRAFIPASVAQMENFFRTGNIVNRCEDTLGNPGDCDASVPYNIPYGYSAPCDPTLAGGSGAFPD